MVDLAAQRARIRTVIEQRVAAVMEHGVYVGGPEVCELEERLSVRTGAPEVVSCSSGTDALFLALMAMDVGAGSAVVLPSFTFAGTAEAVALTGATPVFADVDPGTYLLSPPSVADAVSVAASCGLRTAAVVSVDLFGQPVDPSAVRRAAPEAVLVSDAAQSFGASWDGRSVGCLADITTTSFYPSKPLGCYGDGGAVLCHDAGLAELLRSLRNHGQRDHNYRHERIGTTARLDTIQAAILLSKLAVFDDELCARESVAERYSRDLAGLVEVPSLQGGARSSWAQYTIQTDDRDKVRSCLEQDGVASAVHYPAPLHRQPAYTEFPTETRGCPASDECARLVLSLPMHPYLTPSDQEIVVSAVARAVDTSRRPL